MRVLGDVVKLPNAATLDANAPDPVRTRGEFSRCPQWMARVWMDARDARRQAIGAWAHQPSSTPISQQISENVNTGELHASGGWRERLNGKAIASAQSIDRRAGQPDPLREILNFYDRWELVSQAGRVLPFCVGQGRIRHKRFLLRYAVGSACCDSRLLN